MDVRHGDVPYLPDSSSRRVRLDYIERTAVNSTFPFRKGATLLSREEPSRLTFSFPLSSVPRGISFGRPRRWRASSWLVSGFVFRASPFQWNVKGAHGHSLRENHRSTICQSSPFWTEHTGIYTECSIILVALSGEGET